MGWRMISALMLKDLKLYFANRFFAVITGLGLVAYIGIYLLMPAVVDEKLELGLYMAEIPAALEKLLADEEISLLRAESDEDLQAAVYEGDIHAGYSFPAGSLQKIVMGEYAEVDLYFSSDVPDEFKEIYIMILDEFAYQISGQLVDIQITEYILGPDMAGGQIPARERMLPLLTIIILMMETLGLASLITSEIQAGTLRALLITPLRVEGLFVAKGLFGTLFAFSQTVILMGITGGLSVKPGLILLTLLIGSMLVTGIGFLMASVSKDMMSVLGWGILAILLLATPSFTIMIPGISTGWIKILPSYYLVDTIYRVLNFGAGWGDVSMNLVILLVYAAVFMGLGVIVLKRKFR